MVRNHYFRQIDLLLCTLYSVNTIHTKSVVIEVIHQFVPNNNFSPYVISQLTHIHIHMHTRIRKSENLPLIGMTNNLHSVTKTIQLWNYHQWRSPLQYLSHLLYLRQMQAYHQTAHKSPVYKTQRAHQTRVMTKEVKNSVNSWRTNVPQSKLSSSVRKLVDSVQVFCNTLIKFKFKLHVPAR